MRGRPGTWTQDNPPPGRQVCTTILYRRNSPSVSRAERWAGWGRVCVKVYCRSFYIIEMSELQGTGGPEATNWGVGSWHLCPDLLHWGYRWDTGQGLKTALRCLLFLSSHNGWRDRGSGWVTASKQQGCKSGNKNYNSYWRLITWQALRYAISIYYCM